MSNTQNKQVSTKFQNGRVSVSTKPFSKIATATAICQAKSTKITPNVRLQRFPNQSNLRELEPRSTLHTANADPQNIKRLASKSSYTTGCTCQLKAKHCSVSNCRKGDATLKKCSFPFVSTTRIFRPSSSKIFDYDLSREEKHHFVDWHKPMKSVPVDELQLLRNGHRVTYLETRYGRSPDKRYNYPEATSWRYGWFHGSTLNGSLIQ